MTDLTPAEIEAGVRALFGRGDVSYSLSASGVDKAREHVAAVLRAVLRGRDARLVAETRAKVAEEMASLLLSKRPHIPPSDDPHRKYAVAMRDTLNRSARWIRAHATPPKEDHHG